MDYARRAYPPAYDAARQPGGAANSPATSSAPLRYEDGIRVSINPKYQISSRPEAETPLELPDPPRSEFEFDFGVERRVLAKLMSAGDGVDGFPKVEEDPRVTKFVEMGYDKPAVLMAIMVHGDSHDKVLGFLDNFGKLKEMGFTPIQITGALAIHNNALREASGMLAGD